ncbi:hypothetical protein JTB14_026794 [Gonioctena quinquepunctata]|nr:hypothetical protein JTB14_026794 [Gonioctena quinquepunctata]
MLQELLRMCSTDPDAFIRSYENRTVDVDHRQLEEGTKVVNLKTYGPVYGDKKYHYLMVDDSTDPDIPELEKIEPSEKSFRVFSETLLTVQPLNSNDNMFHTTNGEVNSDTVRKTQPNQEIIGNAKGAEQQRRSSSDGEVNSLNDELFIK